jgi:hypothetical protein
MQKSPYHVTIRPWEPRKLPYHVTQEMLQSAFAEKKSLLLPYLYLGWRRAEIDSKREVVFCAGMGYDRAKARVNFRGNIGSDTCLMIKPQKETLSPYLSSPHTIFSATIFSILS